MTLVRTLPVLLAGLCVVVTQPGCESTDKVGSLVVGGTGSGGSGEDGQGGSGPTFDPRLPVSPHCGGEVQTTGSGRLSLDARYVELRYVGGDCPAHLTIVVTGPPSSDSPSITIEVAGSQGPSSLVGKSTALATLAYPDGVVQQTGADVEITSFPDSAVHGADAGVGSVTGTLKILYAGGMLQGSFASPLCAVEICI